MKVIEFPKAPPVGRNNTSFDVDKAIDLAAESQHRILTNQECRIITHILEEFYQKLRLEEAYRN